MVVLTLLVKGVDPEGCFVGTEEDSWPSLEDCTVGEPVGVVVVGSRRLPVVELGVGDTGS